MEGPLPRCSSQISVYEVTNSFINNTARSLGGAVYLENGALMTVLGNNEFRSNTAETGGAIMAQSAAEAHLQGGDGNTTVFVDNIASVAGGAVTVEDSSVFSSVDGGYLSFDSNYAYAGGGMFAQSYSEVNTPSTVKTRVPLAFLRRS